MRCPQYGHMNAYSSKVSFFPLSCCDRVNVILVCAKVPVNATVAEFVRLPIPLQSALECVSKG